MSISLKTHKMLWGRAANRCAICRIELALDETEVDDEALIGDECHIVARQEGGPRGISEALPFDNRDVYENLLLLCKNHHKQIDDQPNYYTVDKLREIKADHETWVRDNLSSFDKICQRDEEKYASYVDEWERKVYLDAWMDWTTGLITPQPYLLSDVKEKLDEVPRWLLSRVWPKRHPQLENSFLNFRNVLSDLLRVFVEHADKKTERYLTVKFYKGERGWNEYYDRDLQHYCFHVDLIHDLTFELTRAGNFICEHVREYLWPNYRIVPGRLLLSRGTAFELYDYCPLYQDEAQLDCPYPGLRDFMHVRATRGFCVGTGTTSGFFDYCL